MFKIKKIAICSFVKILAYFIGFVKAIIDNKYGFDSVFVLNKYHGG
jgi:hypothetical protein